VDDEASIEDISVTYPRAYHMRRWEDGTEKEREQLSELRARIRQTKESIVLISQCLSPDRPIAAALRRPLEVLEVAVWLSNEVREREGKLGPAPPLGFVRYISRPTAEEVRDKTRLLPAPLRQHQRNVFTGITPATLQLHAYLAVPRVQRTEAEVQAPWDEAYPSDKSAA
jgi:hypothetical protein